MKNHQLTAQGTFEVKLTPEGEDKVGGIIFGKYSVEKKFRGDLEAASTVDMLSATSDDGSGAYVAIERVNGTLHGRSGSFVLMHNGTRTKTSQQLTITAVPGCGAGELVGLEGTMTINIVEGEHFYDFEYSLPK
ncbi:MAG: hypothetical protein B7X04_03090 [Parcubacteria group bacterium 21-54-25]|nr:MAG: hypothetical protein B7X04_03090 [Parcubacteria group bacterium 21-54-25]HQU07937.1 DUF3224 domain-containing protein [Candidatus Paceibacterota bacterium]